MRGMPCKEWFDAKEASLVKSVDIETEVRQAIRFMREEQAARKRATQSLIQKPPPQRAVCEWVSPMEYDGNWARIHIRIRRA